MDIGTADTAIGTEFTKSFAVVTGRVGREANSFTDCRQPSAASAGSKRVLERKLRFYIHKPPGHDKVLGNPPCTLVLKGLDLVHGGAIELAAGNVLVDFGGTLTIRAVRAPDVLGVVDARRTFLLALRTFSPTGKRASVSTAAETLVVATALLIPGPVTERLAVTKGTAVIAVTAGTVEVSGAAAFVERLAVTVAVTKLTALTIAGRTLTAVSPVTEGTTVIVAARAKRTAVIAVTAGTVEVPGAAAFVERLAVTVAVTKLTALTIAG
ncbi:hypothetical protein, partial [Paenarthrobacter sp. NCHU4564]|uniref:hypothetical protein n=1 Tax=Paenarthrobacter sp. NCHU4564 TaxID=3451353 RepID=UPI003F9BE7C9